MTTHGVRMTFGKHDGELITRVPVNYLKWMMCNRTQMWEFAQAEMGRRGTITPDIDVTGHAIDRASMHLHQYWRRTMRTDEGIHAWLIRMASDARKIGNGMHDGVYVHVGVKFVFEEAGCWPVLKTVMPYRPR